MSLKIAQARALDLANTLMVTIVLICIDGQYSVLEAAEFDGDTDAILCTYDPFQ